MYARPIRSGHALSQESPAKLAKWSPRDGLPRIYRHGLTVLHIVLSIISNFLGTRAVGKFCVVYRYILDGNIVSIVPRHLCVVLILRDRVDPRSGAAVAAVRLYALPVVAKRCYFDVV